MITTRRASIPLAALLLAGCGGDKGAPTAEQNRELDQAEQMLNEAPNDLEGIDEGALGETNAPPSAAE